MARHNEIGEKGEIIARQFLIGKGYKILDTNWRHQHKEIDIIAMKDNLVVMVEVKLRSTDKYGQPEEAVSVRKQKFLIEAADNYMQNFDEEAEVRFDVISIIKNGNKELIRHIEEAFIPYLEP